MQYALVTVTEKVDDMLVVEQVQLLNEEEALGAKASLLKLLGVAVAMNSKDNYKRMAAWNAEESPAKAKQCRRLGRSPTGEDVAHPFVE